MYRKKVYSFERQFHIASKVTNRFKMCWVFGKLLRFKKNVNRFLVHTVSCVYPMQNLKRLLYLFVLVLRTILVVYPMYVYYITHGEYKEIIILLFLWVIKTIFVGIDSFLYRKWRLLSYRRRYNVGIRRLTLRGRLYLSA